MTEEQIDKLEQIMTDCRENPSKLSAWETQFMQSWFDRVEEYGISRVRVSEKQWEILDRIAATVGAQ